MIDSSVQNVFSFWHGFCEPEEAEQKHEAVVFTTHRPDVSIYINVIRGELEWLR